MDKIDNFIHDLQLAGVSLEELLFESNKHCQFYHKYDEELHSDPIDQLISWEDTERGHLYWYNVDKEHILEKDNICTVGEFLERLEYHIEPPIVKLIKGL